MHPDEKAIRDLVDRWMIATRAADLVTVRTLMDDDVVFMTFGREPFGKKEMAASTEKMAGVKIDGSSEIQEIQLLGDWAWMRNRIRVSAVSPSGRPWYGRGMRSQYCVKNRTVGG